MRRLSLFVLSLSLVGGCSVKSSLLGKTSADSPSPSSRASGNSDSEDQKTAPAIPRAAGDEEALSDRAQAALALVGNVEASCPKVKKPPKNEEACTEAIDAFMDKYHRIGLDIQRDEVKQARRTVKAAEDQRRVWNGYRSDQRTDQHKAYVTYNDDARGLKEAFAALKQGRKNKAGYIFTSAIADDAERLRDSLKRRGFEHLDEFAAKHCNGATSEKTEDWHNDRTEKCALVKNHEKYYRQWVEAGLMAAVLEDTGAWQNAVGSLDKKGFIYTVNYNTFMSGRLDGKASKRAKAIAKATGMKFDAGKEVKKRLKPARKELKKAMAKWSKKSQWKVQAGKARHRDGGGKAAVKRNLRDRGEKLIRFGAYDKAWNVKFKFNRPVERSKDTAVLVRAKGESFCRIYHLRIVQDHQGGGRYTKTKVYTRGFDQFYMSACK